ncbi:MAG: hypothetical protein HC802_20700 [Caldilineaceae bacterium]|nr:hypothetical protein [Caldilineaceae bacterium]
MAELNQLQKGEVGAQLEVRRIERYQIFLALALLSFTAMWLIPERQGDVARRRVPALSGRVAPAPSK